MTTAANQPAGSRGNTFEKMLELEQRNKIHRMHASSLVSHQIPSLHTSTGPRRDLRSDLENRPRTMQDNGRAMTTPNLSLSIPVTQQVNGSTKYIISSQGAVIPQQEEKEEEEQDSDASSICQSPGWDDVSGKRRKKEKKEKEKEKKRKEKEKAKMETTKLHKTPPKKRLSKTAVAMDRSASAPMVTVVPIVQEVVGPMEVNKKPGGRSRRGSLELGFRNLLHAKKAIPTPWKSSHATAATPVTPGEMPTVAASTSGFIGGLKLRQSVDANTQDVMRRLTMPIGVEGEHLVSSEKDAAPKLGEHSSSTFFTEPPAPVSTHVEPARTTSQWESIYAQAALMTSPSGDRAVDDDTPMMERNIRKARRSHPPTSKYFESEESNSRRDLSRSSNRSSYQSDGQDSTLSSPTTNGSSIPTDHPGDWNHSRSSSYVQHSRQQSQELTMSDPPENYAVGGGSSERRKSESRGRSIFNRSRSRTRNASDVRPGTAETNAVDARSNRFINKNDPTSQWHPGQTTEPPMESVFTHRPKSSFAGVKSLRNAARAAFSKNGGSIHSGSDTYSSAELLTATPFRPQTGNRAATTDSASLRSTAPSKPERVLGEPIPPAFIKEAGTRNSSPHAAQVGRGDLGPSGASSFSSQITGRYRTHSRSSSEEYSTPDEYSNITTPTGSRPHSQKGYFPKMEDINAGSKRNMSTGTINQPKDAYFMSGAIPSDENTESGREDWSRTAMPIEMTDEESGKTPTSGTPPLPQLVDGLHRRPSLARSISTPELQDLSFLPALKHQALAPRPPQKSKHRKTRSRTEKTPRSVNDSLSEPLAPPPPPPTTKSENSSPTSPLSSQYLKNARLALPRPANKQFAHSQVQQVGGNGPDPIAKMFVVCCSCKYFHDMPSKIYECMAKPDNVVRDANLGVQGVVSTSVKCPWCAHGMSTKCCAGYAAVVYLREKLH